MALLAVMLLFVVLGVLAAAVYGHGDRMVGGVLAGVGLFFTMTAAMCAIAFIIPPPTNWLAIAVCGFIGAVAASRGGKPPWRLLIVSLVGAVLAARLCLDILDLAMSTRAFDSDASLLRAALKRGMDDEGLTVMAWTLACITLGALAGGLAASQLRRQEQQREDVRRP